MKTSINTLSNTIMLASILLISGCNDSSDSDFTADSVNASEEDTSGKSGTESSKLFTVTEGNDLNNKSNELLSLNPAGPGGSPNQSLRSGDTLAGSPDQDDVLIGGLGVDVLVGDKGDDILIGGTEDFNSSVDGDDNGSDNRDRAFGNDGDDAFIWAPGDGSDFFDGGDGIDVLVFGVLGEQRDRDGSAEGAPFFNVNPPGTDGSQDFDGIYLDENNAPVVSVSASPGFCSVVDNAAYAEEFDRLNVDHIVRFSLRGIANAFDAGERDDDDGLRVAVTTRSVEYLVCTQRSVAEDGGIENIEVLDLTSEPPAIALLSELPDHIVQMIR